VENADALNKAYEVTVAGFRIDGTSSQKPYDEVETPEKAIEPPVSLEALAKLSTISGIRSSIIDAIARNTVGLGYSVDVAPGKEEEAGDPRDTISEITTILEALAHRDLRLDNSGFTELLMAVKTDEEEVGWGFLEVSRSELTGRIDGLFHVPGKLMRRLRDRSGYVLLDPSGEKNNDFYNFGEKVEYTDKGEATSKIAKGKSWNRNEVICFRLYTSESRDYGMPSDIALALEYAGDKLAAEYNVSFFDAGGTPRRSCSSRPPRVRKWAASSSVSRRKRRHASRTPSSPMAVTATESRSSRSPPGRTSIKSSSVRRVSATWASCSTGRTTPSASSPRSGCSRSSSGLALMAGTTPRFSAPSRWSRSSTRSRTGTRRASATPSCGTWATATTSPHVQADGRRVRSGPP
jgi:hypothetical protein